MKTETHPDFKFCVSCAIIIGFLLLAAILLSGCSPEAAVMPVAQPVSIPIANLGVGLVGAGGLAKVGEAEQASLQEQIMLADVAHAEARHGEGIVDMAEGCIKSRGIIRQMMNPGTQRIAKVCQMEDGRFITEILEDTGDLVTAFIKEKMKTIDQVVRYLTNGGYQ